MSLAEMAQEALGALAALAIYHGSWELYYRRLARQQKR